MRRMKEESLVNILQVVQWKKLVLEHIIYNMHSY